MSSTSYNCTGAPKVSNQANCGCRAMGYHVHVSQRSLLVWSLSFIAALSLAIFLFVSANTSEKTLNTDTVRAFSQEKEIEYWQHRIVSSGASQAHSEFLEIWDDGDFDISHLHGHLFGEALYRTGGELSDCALGAYHCNHGFMISAIEEQGVAEVASMLAKCQEKINAYPCTHGVGHGLVAYFGIDPTGIGKAFAMCRSLEGQAFGCFTGASMELMDATLEMPWKWDDSINPCDTLPQAFRIECTFSLPYFWHHQLIQEVGAKATYTDIAERCAALPTTLEREACIRGTGHNVAPLNNFNPEAIADACSAFTTDENSNACIIGALSFIKANGPAESAPRVCEAIARRLNSTCSELGF